MQIITSLENLNIPDKTSVALGNFDGIHVGHQKIMENAIRAAKDTGEHTGCEIKSETVTSGMKSLCFTFSNHPFNYILGREEDDPTAIKLICSEEDKIAMIDEMGFDILVNIPFDEQIMKMRAHDFFADILAGKLNAGFISVGFNYSYGARAEGKPEMLQRECEEAGIGCSVQDAVRVDGEIVSSTLIREMISAGSMELVRKYLGRPFTVSGRVEHGNKLGSTKGYPTANIPFPAERMVPPSGVYFTRTEVEGRIYNSVSNLGTKPTIDGANKNRSIETYLFDFEGDLYGREIIVYFDKFSRGEVKFASKEDLFRQISKDCENALEYHSRQPDGQRQ